LLSKSSLIYVHRKYFIYIKIDILVLCEAHQSVSLTILIKAWLWLYRKVSVIFCYVIKMYWLEEPSMRKYGGIGWNVHIMQIHSFFSFQIFVVNFKQSPLRFIPKSLRAWSRQANHCTSQLLLIYCYFRTLFAILPIVPHSVILKLCPLFINWNWNRNTII
jgi:hypothetical protein